MTKEYSLRNIQLLSDIPEGELNLLGQRCKWRNFEPDELILNLNDQSTDIYFIVRGEVQASVFSETGRRVIMSDLKSGDYFGEFSAIDGQPRSATIVALTRTLVAQMSDSLFIDILSKYPTASIAVMKSMVNVIRTLNERVVEFSTLGVPNRVHAELLRLAYAGRIVDGAGRISPPPTHAEIASRISTHREAVTRELKQLERKGVIERNKGSIVIKNLKEFEQMVEEARAGKLD
ncbi:MAG: Crp/Fnr family transcriptional regulator [Pseudomonadota bacterium]|jgi:CRP/FNR family cyclic AMP-dependent transcriptional regulator|nr:Crp/Fnr family transcriptional regulator [Rhodospirillaceae bacterium]MEC7971122.1 Crp/Fnr family transcriptional regulator [Pseudomonadota bacterium]